jgi:hypothetical protein
LAFSQIFGAMPFGYCALRADYLQAFEAGLEQTVRELLNPALQLSALATQLLLEPHVAAQHFKSSQRRWF